MSALMSVYHAEAGVAVAAWQIVRSPGFWVEALACTTAMALVAGWFGGKRERR